MLESPGETEDTSSDTGRSSIVFESMWEYTFWKEAYLSMLTRRSYDTESAGWAADRALGELRKRNQRAAYTLTVNSPDPGREPFNTPSSTYDERASATVSPDPFCGSGYMPTRTDDESM